MADRDMAASVPGSELLGTFECIYKPDESATEASISLRLVNYSEPAISRRHAIKFFSTSYISRTISVFSKIGQHGPPGERYTQTLYEGVQHGDDLCSTFDNSHNPLSYILASTASEVAFFTSQFPPQKIRATGYFIPSNTGTLLKLCVADRRIRVLPPAIGHVCFPQWQLRHTVLSQEINQYTEHGFLFVYVTLWGNTIVQDDRAGMHTNEGLFLVPSSLATVLALTFGLNPPSLPPHIMSLIHYFDGGDIDGNFLDDLHAYDIGQIVELVVLAIDVFGEDILRGILHLIAEKVNNFGGPLDFSEYTARLRFMRVEGDLSSL